MKFHLKMSNQHNRKNSKKEKIKATATWLRSYLQPKPLSTFTKHISNTPRWVFPTATIYLSILDKYVLHGQMHSDQASAVNKRVPEEYNRDAGTVETDL